LIIAFFVLITGYSTDGSNGINLDFKIELLDASKKLLDSQSFVRTFRISGWRQRPFATHLGPDKVANFLGISTTDGADSPLPYIMVCGGFPAKATMEGTKLLHLIVIDNLTNSTIEFEQPIYVHKD
jgi:hypothetical protein